MYLVFGLIIPSFCFSLSANLKAMHMKMDMIFVCIGASRVKM